MTVLGAAYAGQAAETVRFHDEASDTTRLNQLLRLPGIAEARTPEALVELFGRQFIDTPYVAHTLECDSAECLTVNLGQLDCTTFVETAMALAYTGAEHRRSWRDFVYNLRRLRYRGGEVDGYASRLHYIADWAADNRHRGNLVDVTESFPRVNTVTRTIDFMSAHRDRYPALVDDEQYRRIRSVEDGYRNHRFPYIKTTDLASKATQAAFRSGDVIALVSNLKDLDVTHMGIVVKDAAGVPYLMHASSVDGKVEISDRPLAEVVKRNRNWIGVRVFRLKI